MAALASGRTRRMDVGFLDDRPFLNVAGAGLDALVGADFHAHGRDGGRRGIFSYLRLSLRRALCYPAEAWTLDAGAERFEGRALIVAFVNGRQYGGGAIVAPHARLDDGLLDVVVFEGAPRAEVILNAPRLFLGSIDAYRRYRHMRAARARLSGPPAFLRHRDGELDAAAAAADVRLEPKALRIRVPKKTAEDPAGPFGLVEDSGEH
jgi:diacylglycerol kinase family enzyme